MMTMEKLVEALGGAPDRLTIQTYISHEWLRPELQDEQPHFEEIDIARARLVHQLQHEMSIDDHAMDVVLGLLDQLYGLHERMRQVHHAISRQPEHVRREILTLLREP